METDQQKVRTWGMLCHLTALAGLIVPLGNILGPMVIWLIKKNEISGVEQQGKEAMNFQISMLIYSIVAGILCLIFIGFLLLIGLAVANVILTIIASIKTNNGEAFTYPLTLRLIK